MRKHKLLYGAVFAALTTASVMLVGLVLEPLVGYELGLRVATLTVLATVLVGISIGNYRRERGN